MALVGALIGFRGTDRKALNRTPQIAPAGATLELASREDFVAVKAIAGGPVDLADARAVVDLGRGSLDVELMRSLAQRVGRETVKAAEVVVGAVD